VQGPIVFLIVAAAAAYAAWQLMPQGMRRWLVGRLAAIAPSRRAWLARLEAGAGDSACGSCKGCADGNAPAARVPSRIEVHRRPGRPDRR
jgi:hypothetical protein